MDPTIQTQSSAPIQEESVKQKKSSVVPIVIVIIVVIICIEGVVGYHLLSKPSTTTQTQTTSDDSGIPTPKMTDFAPGIPASQKTTLLIEHSDSTMENVLLPTTQVASYIKSLPVGDRVISQNGGK